MRQKPQPVGTHGKRTKLQPSKSARAYTERIRTFLDHYMVHGVGKAAAIAAGYSPQTAGQQATNILKRPDVIAKLKRRQEHARKISGLSVDRTLNEIARLAYFDPAGLYREDGSLKHVNEMDDDTRAAIASVEHAKPGVTKLKLHDKNAALDKAAKHLGLYEKDNAQRGESLQLQVVLVQSNHPRVIE